ncbi:YjdF family protein [Clostridium weizhouense]|uniref:YjdF family protein n=1 Tax=Clostridium weizhouense TaxID=2859781 RepID=A0ABS7AQ04_9CLOT|nr:YjdF family protein [Clostridium weizhouense]MBW6410629.1 YjdF family protein [Clostridium weizhouense]
MNKITSKLTVFFEDPFWIGICEYISDGTLKVSKITFGQEPKDYEVYDFILKNLYKLRYSSPIINEPNHAEKKINPKRMQRLINKQLKITDVGTKAQQALKLQHEQNKLQRKSFNKQKKEDEKNRQFELRQQKKKAKHRGK